MKEFVSHLFIHQTFTSAGTVLCLQEIFILVEKEVCKQNSAIKCSYSPYDKNLWRCPGG